MNRIKGSKSQDRWRKFGCARNFNLTTANKLVQYKVSEINIGWINNVDDVFSLQLLV